MVTCIAVYGVVINSMDVEFMFQRKVKSILVIMLSVSVRVEGKLFTCFFVCWDRSLVQEDFLLTFLLVFVLLSFHGVVTANRIETWPHGAKYEGDYRKDKRNGKFLGIRVPQRLLVALEPQEGIQSSSELCLFFAFANSLFVF